MPKIKDKLLQLPKSDGFYGFTDDRGILYFVELLDTKPITKFHKKEGQQTIFKSKRMTCNSQDYKCMKTEYTYGILLRIGFWTFYQGKRSTITSNQESIKFCFNRTTHFF